MTSEYRQEKRIEKELIRAVRAAGGLCPKFISPGMNGVPDRIILLPGGRIAFAELKAPGERPRHLQEVRIAQFCRLGFPVFVIDGVEQIPDTLKQIGGDAR